MIELSGLDPDRDIEIEIVGRRPGEKLHEELFNSYERARATSAEKILLAEREPLGAEAVESMFAEIGLLVLEGDAAGLAAKVSELSALHVEARSGRLGRRSPSREEPARRLRTMRLQPSYTLRIHDAPRRSRSRSRAHFTQVGAIAAFAALLGIAVLSLLVFSQAREIRRLREWAGRAPERAAELEQRVSAEAAARAQQPRVSGAAGSSGPARGAAQRSSSAGAAPASRRAAQRAQPRSRRRGRRRPHDSRRRARRPLTPGTATPATATPGAAAPAAATPGTSLAAVAGSGRACDATAAAAASAGTSPADGAPGGEQQAPRSGSPAAASAAAQGATPATAARRAGGSSDGSRVLLAPRRRRLRLAAPASASAAGAGEREHRQRQPRAAHACAGDGCSRGDGGEERDGERDATLADPPLHARRLHRRRPRRRHGAPAAAAATVAQASAGEPRPRAAQASPRTARHRRSSAPTAAIATRSALRLRQRRRSGAPPPVRRYRAERRSPARATVLIVGGLLVGCRGDRRARALARRRQGRPALVERDQRLVARRRARTDARRTSTRSSIEQISCERRGDDQPGATERGGAQRDGNDGLAHRVSSELQQRGYSQATALSGAAGRQPGDGRRVRERARGGRAERRARARCRAGAADRKHRRLAGGLGDGRRDRRPRQGCDRRHSRLPRHPRALGQAARAGASRT